MSQTETTTRRTGLASISDAYESLRLERPGILASESGGELSWLMKARERDAVRWRSEGFPTRKADRWKYTSLAPLERARVVLPAPVDSPVPERGFEGPFSAEIVFVNGHLDSRHGHPPKTGPLRITVLSEILAECVNEGWTPERRDRLAAFRAHVGSSDAARETIFAAMNTSLMQDAILIHVPEGVSIPEPLLIRHHAVGSEADGEELPMICPRVFVHLARGAELAVIERFTGERRYFANSVTDLKLDERSRLSHCRIQDESGDAIHIGTTRVHQSRDSFSETRQFDFGARLARHDLHVSLEGEGAEANFDGLYLTEGGRHVDNYTLVDHLVPQTTSEQVYKGILTGESRAVFNGHVRIHRDAQKSSAAQLNKNLLLSRKAEIDTRPELQIDADDVKATHGATIGQIDPEHVFYLRTRGVSEAAAVRMLSRGFARDIVFRSRNEAIRRITRGLVDERVEALEESHA